MTFGIGIKGAPRQTSRSPALSNLPTTIECAILVSKTFSIELNVVPHRNPPLRWRDFGEMSIGSALTIFKNKRLKASGVTV
jgi:hypothetical protein